MQPMTDDGVEAIATWDRERLLALVEQLLPLQDAARVVVQMVPRGPLPPAARQALLELHLALHLAAVDVADCSVAEVEEVDADFEDLQRLSA
jgi:hypothetical protein